MAVNGTEIILLVNVADKGDPLDYVAVGCQRDVDFDETNDTIDFSCKEQREAIWGYGRYEATVTLEHLYVPNDQAYQKLLIASREAELIKIIRRESGEDEEEAEAVITSISRSFPDQGEATVSVDLQISGAFKEVS